MSTVAIIPARGGSKGIPRKNLQPIGGTPLVGWAVRAALAARMIDDVYVSSDDPEILKVAEQYGAKTIKRPWSLAADEVANLPVIEHAISTLGETPDAVVIVQCTSPLTTSEDIDNAVGGLHPPYGSVVSVTPDHGFIFSREGNCLNYSDDELRLRRQDRDVRYRVTGAVYVFRPSTFDIWGGNVNFSIIPPERSIDIDSPVDLHVAESLLNYEKAWIVLGAGPDAQEMLPLARMRYPHAKIVTTNGGGMLFDAPDHPDAYLLNDMRACRIYEDKAHEMREHGARLVTLRRDPRALKDRRVDHFDEFLPFSGQPEFVRGGYGGAGISGVICLQYAVNHGARSVHMVGMNGYTGKYGGDYFDGHEPENKTRKRKMHTDTVIQPFTQSVVRVCPDVEFYFYGALNYSVAGDNVHRVNWKGETHACANIA